MARAIFALLCVVHSADSDADLFDSILAIEARHSDMVEIGSELRANAWRLNAAP